MQQTADYRARQDKIKAKDSSDKASPKQNLLPVIVAVLLLSLVGNAAGITFFCLYLHQRGQTVHYKKQAGELNHQLQITRIAGAYLPEFNTPIRLTPQIFMSPLDNHEDCFAMAPSAVYAPDGNITLLVYLHGMGGDYLEPFCSPKHKPFGPVLVSHYPGTILLSPNYRGRASFGTALALADITQNIRQVLQQYPVKRIIVAGTSMGGCTALNYSATAPGDIQDKITGIISAEGTGDLAALYRETKSDTVHIGIGQALGGSPDQAPQNYRQFSFLSNIHRLPPRIKVALVSGQRDVIIPPHFQDELLGAIMRNNNPVKMIKFDGPHGFIDDTLMLQALAFATGS